MLLAANLILSCARRPETSPWRSVMIPTDADFAGVWFSDSLNGWITGGGWAIEGGIIGRTRDGGRSWTFQSGLAPGAGAGSGFGRVQFRDSLRGCVVGSGGTVMLTDDGGENWRPATHGGRAGAALYGLQFIDALNGWAIGPGSIVRTEDGGETWRRLIRSDNENGYLSGSAVHFLDASRGWLAGQAAEFMRSDDGGSNWIPVTLPLPSGQRPALRDVFFLDRRLGWVVGEEGVIFHTEDGGERWVRQQLGVPVVRVLAKGEKPKHDVVPELDVPPDRLALHAVRFANSNRGWAVGYYADAAESVVLGTRNGGATWTVERTQPGELLRSLFALDTLHVWAAGDRARTSPQVILRYAPAER
ncbi:MAG: WD40/YVTN/BNR-like repeat-containing protein [Candidatus Eiseniibacteriota bacterium]